MVRLDGFGKVDQHDALELACRPEQRQDGAAPRGFLLSNAQFAALGVHFPQLAGREEQCRAELNEVREIVLQDLLQADQQPRRREVHADMAKMLLLVRGFLESAAALGPRSIGASRSHHANLRGR
ncbi:MULTISPECIES: hypothetical protein [unclassified Bradyrhizobium]|uniref:hypothetical protein n=1 Tax=unclassified Bradyrhizobium TaxID=2631580 RepID=UPI001FF7036E|nr:MULTISPECIES: hypothetical protein [unclassified Bradyrhizobium]MCK1711254.1 hypothetical protein [Bradyrhizobium sp. 143]MCK1726688.1 hypothetical protein [Bradyrhizobium sp. 142]